MSLTLFRRMGLAALAMAAAWGLSAESAAAAGKLIQMRNGRVLRAASVRNEGNTVIATLEGGHTIGFPAAVVLDVEDDRLGGDEGGGPLNVVRSSGGGGAGGGGFAPPAPMENPQEEVQEIPPEPVQEAPQAPGVTLDDPNRQPIGPQGAAPGPGPRNRRVNRLGFKPRPGDN